MTNGKRCCSNLPGERAEVPCEPRFSLRAYLSEHVGKVGGSQEHSTPLVVFLKYFNDGTVVDEAPVQDEDKLTMEIH